MNESFRGVLLRLSDDPTSKVSAKKNGRLSASVTDRRLRVLFDRRILTNTVNPLS